MTIKTSLPSMAPELPKMVATVGPLGSVERLRRAMKRSSPTDGSAVVLWLRICGVSARIPRKRGRTENGERGTH